MKSSMPTAVLPTDHVASSPPAHLVLQPPVVPLNMQSGVVSYYDMTCTASQLEFGYSLRNQEKTRSLFSHLLPGLDLLSTKIPCHVVGGYSSWAGAIHAILHFFRMDLNNQLDEIKKVLCVHRTIFYKKNLKLLISNRPLPCPLTVSSPITPPTRTAQAKIHALLTRSITCSVNTVEAAARLGVFGIGSTIACSEHDASRSPCVACGFVRTVPILLTKETKAIARDDLGDKCIQCLQYKQQQEKKFNKSQELSSIVSRQMTSPLPCSASKFTTVIDLASLASSALGSYFSSVVFSNQKRR